MNASRLHVDPTCPFDCCQVWCGKLPPDMENPEISGISSLASRLGYTSQCHSSVMTMTSPQVQVNQPNTGITDSTNNLTILAALRRKFQTNPKLLPKPSIPTLTPTSTLYSGQKWPRLRSRTITKKGSRQIYSSTSRRLSSGGAASILKPITSTTTKITPQKPAFIINLVKCSHCPQFCMDDEDLRKHIKESHPPKVLSCSSCGTLCVGENNLKQHELTHQRIGVDRVLNNSELTT